MSDSISTFILGVIEGVTEFLPVSSTGHLLIAEQWLGQRSELFNVAIQSGAILAIVLIYFRRLSGFVVGISAPENRDYVAKLFVAFLITSVLGLTAEHFGFKLPQTVLPVAIATFVGGFAILAIEQYVARKPLSSVVTWNVAIWVGVCQILAGVFPGTSRSGATIFAAMLAGLTSRPAATEFSFLLGIPVMFAATALEFWKTRSNHGQIDWSELTIGFVTSAVVAFIVVKWLLRYVQTHRFTIFAWYRIVLGGVLLVLIWRGVVH
ncbi:MAG TPA: undecaprenyl-diphosphate phosphatase [Steroidobacteraceae bacterium]|nr:undecaprenyl-diphosphate phosphatase [Steroidobacteraceae bacterium]